MSRLRVAIVNSDTGGTGYFRAALVKRALDRDLGLGVDVIHCDRWRDAFAFVDVVYLVNPFPASVSIETLTRLKQAGKKIIVDVDDAIFDLPPTNPVWSNSQSWAWRKYKSDAFAAADMLTAATEYIGRAFALRFGGKPYRVVPIAYDETIPLARASGRLTWNQTPVIGWVGGTSHYADLAALDGLWPELLERGYGLLFCGCQPKFLCGRSEKTTGERVALEGWGSASTEQYMQLVPTLGFDVGLAPLIDDQFNRCKNELKTLDYSHLAGCPAVISDTENYRHVKDDGRRLQKVAGFDIDDWLAAIERALEVMRTEGRRYSLPERHRLSNTAPLWAQAFKDAAEIVNGATVETAAMVG